MFGSLHAGSIQGRAVVRTSKDLSRVFYLDPDRLQSF